MMIRGSLAACPGHRGGSGLVCRPRVGREEPRASPALQEQGSSLELKEGTFRLDFRQKFFNPRKGWSQILWISLRLRGSDLLVCVVWVWVLTCSSKHLPQNIHPELFSVGCWTQTWNYWIYWSVTGHIHHPNTFWAPWTTPEYSLPTASSGVLALPSHSHPDSQR